MADTHETTADLIAWLRRPREGENAYLTLWRDEIADRLDAAHKRERGDCAKLREALDRLAIASEGFLRTHSGQSYADTMEALDKARAALSTPPRNCDVYTSDELKVKFKSELASELPIANEHEKNLVAITAMGVIDTLLAPATEKKGGTK